MPLLGQASGGWTESSSALRLLHVGIRNTVGILTADSFTQTNPPAVSDDETVSTRVDTTLSGVLSGSVAFTRPDSGSNYVGGPGSAAQQLNVLQLAVNARQYHALGCFINSANGNAYENTPGVASGKGPYVSAMGTYGNALYETNLLALVAANADQGQAITYINGQQLVASRNGYLMPRWVLGLDGVAYDADIVGVTAESYVVNAGGGNATILGVLKMPPDSVQTELVYDQRV